VSADATSLSEAAFAGLMAAVGPFEAAPRIAVAVSGGGDSMALGLLADRWARKSAGNITALTVDHGLRPDSAAEAARVGHWLAARRIGHVVLRWDGPRPAAGIQEAAREARYRLMTAWCRDAGVLHLLLAHNLEDQAGTFLMRLQRDSGADGLAAMTAVAETPAVRLVRPLLAVSRGRLRATLGEFGQDWVEDPSNRDPRFARTRLDAALPVLADAGFPAARLAAAAGRLGHGRAAIEESVSNLLARCCALHPAGFATIDAAILTEAPERVSQRALARLLMCVGGGAHGPRREKLVRLHARLAANPLDKARTLGGCRVMPMNGRLLVCRERRGTPRPLAAVAATRVVWDRRFVIDFTAAGDGPGTGAFLGRLGRDGWAEIVGERPALRQSPIPPPTRLSLPALHDADGVVAVPHLNYRRVGGAVVTIGRIRFQPAESLSGRGFFLA
jgi:tRNA(Ile)-lysidine synthase